MDDVELSCWSPQYWIAHSTIRREPFTPDAGISAAIDRRAKLSKNVLRDWITANSEWKGGLERV